MIIFRFISSKNIDKAKDRLFIFRFISSKTTDKARDRMVIFRVMLFSAGCLEGISPKTWGLMGAQQVCCCRPAHSPNFEVVCELCATPVARQLGPG